MGKEIWKDVDIKGFEGLYKVSNFGNIISVRRGKQMKGGYDKRGYQTVALSNISNHITTGVYRLVALAFIPNPENKPCVNHIDSNPRNNHVSNLEWVTYSENALHAHRNNRHPHKGLYYTDEMVNAVTHLLQHTDHTFAEIAEIVGINKGNVSFIKTKQKNKGIIFPHKEPYLLPNMRNRQK
jgi:hypothetical protein